MGASWEHPFLHDAPQRGPWGLSSERGVPQTWRMLQNQQSPQQSGSWCPVGPGAGIGGHGYELWVRAGGSPVPTWQGEPPVPVPSACPHGLGAALSTAGHPVLGRS